MGVFNQYSLLLSLIVGGALLAYGLWRWQRPRRLARIALFGVYLIIALGIVLAVRYPDTNVNSVVELDTLLDNGRPTVVMLYSNY